jgi:general secretion pathway protein J
MSTRRCGRGFTLIELLVAMAIVAVIGVMALGGLTHVINQQTIGRERSQRWQKIQFAMRVIVQDLSQLQPRPTRDELGEAYQPSLLASPTAQFGLEFSRGGWANPGGFARGTVLRVAYDVEENDDKDAAIAGSVLVRFHWPVMDRTFGTPPVRTELLEGVEDIEVRFLDSAGQWHLDWPPLQTSGPQSWVLRPRAVEFAIELKDFGRVWRLVETSG